jgi:NAD(P)-dependent dehydrogenase (short-subunit alcohol dehydrogenase family)
MRLLGKTAFVTGAGSGIGAAIVRRFAAEGASVVLFDRDAEAVERVTKAISALGGQATMAVGDVGNAADVRGAIATLARLDILVNNAGIGYIGTVEETLEEELDRLYRVNVKGIFHALQAALPLLTKGSGVVLNMASVAAKVGLEARFAYAMTKGAVLAMTLSVARDYLSRGVRCNCICPARVHTPFVDAYLAKNFAGREGEVFAELSRWQPMGRMGTPEEIAALALFLCSDEASFITGTAYDVDGGVVSLR